MAKKETDRFVKVLAENGFVTSSEIWVDTQTGVEYLYHASGKPLLHRRTPDAPEYK